MPCRHAVEVREGCGGLWVSTLSYVCMSVCLAFGARADYLTRACKGGTLPAVNDFAGYLVSLHHHGLSEAHGSSGWAIL
jgi:hypothetical protein